MLDEEDEDDGCEDRFKQRNGSAQADRAGKVTKLNNGAGANVKLSGLLLVFEIPLG